MNMPTEAVRVRGAIDAPSSRLWLVKWCVLAVPHYPILIGLYLVYPLVTLAAGVTILFTGRYPAPVRLQCRRTAVVVAGDELPLPDEHHRPISAVHPQS